MTKETKPIAFTQIEEALEERQKPDRRQTVAAVPTDVNVDRRRQDRRNGKKAK